VSENHSQDHTITRTHFIVQYTHTFQTQTASTVDRKTHLNQHHTRKQITIVPSANLEAVPAHKNSTVIILQGEFKGHTGNVPLTDSHTYTCMYTHKCEHADVEDKFRLCTYTDHACIHTCIHTRMECIRAITQKHVHTQTYVHVHTCGACAQVNTKNILSCGLLTLWARFHTNLRAYSYIYVYV